MGKLRARTEEELTARRQEILGAAAHQLMETDYDAVTLATIAEATSVGRTSMYTYYDTKEAVFVDLMISEYELLEHELLKTFRKKMARERFCKKMAALLWAHPILLKLLSLQLSVWDRRYNDALIERFVSATHPYMQALDKVLQTQFPDADDNARNRFKLQFTVYCNALYLTEHLPESQMDAMNKRNYFNRIPSGSQICYDGLMLLSSALE